MWTKVLKNLLRYISLTKFYSFISIFVSINILVLNTIAFFYGILNLYNILLILAIAHCFGAFIIFLKLTKISIKKIYINYFKKFIIFSLPIIPGSILNFLNTFVDRYIISIFLDLMILVIIHSHLRSVLYLLNIFGYFINYFTNLF